jgi:hypothetical protein
MDQLPASTMGIPIRGLTRSPVRGIFSIQGLHDLVGAKNATSTRPVAVRLFGEQPDLAAAKYRLVANRELSHVDIWSSL